MHFLSSRGVHIFILLILATTLLLTPFITSAQGFLEPLVPCGTSDTHPCGFCDVFKLAHNITTFLISFAVLGSVLLFMWAGFLYVTAGGSESQISRAHKTFKAVAIGLIIALLAWTIVDVVLRSLVADEFWEGAKGWNDLTCEPPRSVEFVGGTSSGGGDGGGGVIPAGSEVPIDITKVYPGAVAADAYPNSAALLRLKSAGFDVDTFSPHGDVKATAKCMDPTRRTCTSLNGIKQVVLDSEAGVINIKDKCDCRVIINGGTETGHSTGKTVLGRKYNHGTGYKIDLDRDGGSTELDKYMAPKAGGGPPQFVLDTQHSSGGYRTTSVSGYPAYEFTDKDNNTITVINEGSHWDIRYIPEGG